MRRVPLFLRAAVVCSSLTLLLGFVAMKAGAFRVESIDSPPQTNTVMMPGTKSAPMALDEFIDGDGKTGVEVPPEWIKPPAYERTDKHGNPLIVHEEVEIPANLFEYERPKPGSSSMLMPSTKRAEVFDSKFPAKPPVRAPDSPPVTFPSTKSMAPAINFTPSPPPSKVVAPQTMKGKGY